MKTTGQKGFSIVEVLLTVVAVGLVGFIGWFVYHSGQAANKDYASASSSSVPMYKKKASASASPSTGSSVSSQPEKASAGPTTDGPLPSQMVTSGPYAGWKTSTLKYEKISFDYPADWTVNNQSQSIPKKLNGCTYPGIDEVYLTSPSKEQVLLHAGVDCIGDGGTKAFGAVPINSLGQNLYLAFEGSEGPGVTATSPNLACLAKTANPDTPLDFNSKNIFEMTPTPSSTPVNEFCYYPYMFFSDAQGDSSSSTTVSSIKNSKDFATAEKIFESMKY